MPKPVENKTVATRPPHFCNSAVAPYEFDPYSYWEMPAAATATLLRHGAVSFRSRAALPVRLPSYTSQSARHGLRLRNAGAALQLGDGRRAASLGGAAAALRRPPRFLCLHGFRTSAEVMRRQVVGRWPAEVTSRLDLVFVDGPVPAEGASPVAGVFDPPYYEWFQFVGEDFLKCRNFDRCVSYLEQLMIREGPFDGLLGFSQGAAVSAVLAGLQEQGLALTGVAKVKCVIAIAGGKIHAPMAAARAFASKIMCPSLHFIGDDDFVKDHSEELLEAFADPLVIRHPCGHTVPKFDDKGLQIMLTYLDKVERDIGEHPSTDIKIIALNSEAQIPGV